MCLAIAVGADTLATVTVSLQQQIDQAAEWIRASKHHVVFTGAGISTDSGLPDFRGPDGVWTRRDAGLPPPKATVASDRIQPNPAHFALVDLVRAGKLAFLISQNVDGLHLESGIPNEALAELHGNSRLMRCLGCDIRISHEAAGWDKAKWGTAYRTQAPQADQPTCPRCDGRLISSIVNFDDPMPARELELAYAHSGRADLFFVIGSSLVVSPANDMPARALANGAKLILLNRGETPFDDRAHLRIDAGIGEVLPAICERVVG